MSLLLTPSCLAALPVLLAGRQAGREAGRERDLYREAATQKRVARWVDGLGDGQVGFGWVATQDDMPTHY